MQPSPLLQVLSSINVSMTQSRADPGAHSDLAAINDVERDLHATTNEIALSLSLFIFVQGNFPLIWSAISEVKGRKFVYIFAMIVRSSLGEQLQIITYSRFSSSGLPWQGPQRQSPFSSACVCCKQRGRVRCWPLVQEP